MAATIFSGPLTNVFVPTQPFVIVADCAVLDFQLTIPANTVQVQWYPEFTSGNPLAASTLWYRETAEEDLGNGDVRMPPSVRRFSTYGADADLPTGVYRFSVQLIKKHNFCRLQILGNTASAVISIPFGEIPSAP